MMCNIDCPHLSNCISANTPKCQSCQNNKNHKVDYYRRVPDPYGPSYPYYPYPYTPWPYTNPYPTWITITTNTTAQTGDYYTAVMV